MSIDDPVKGFFALLWTTRTAADSPEELGMPFNTLLRSL